MTVTSLVDIHKCLKNFGTFRASFKSYSIEEVDKLLEGLKRIQASKVEEREEHRKVHEEQYKKLEVIAEQLKNADIPKELLAEFMGYTSSEKATKAPAVAIKKETRGAPAGPRPKIAQRYQVGETTWAGRGIMPKVFKEFAAEKGLDVNTSAGKETLKELTMRNVADVEAEQKTFNEEFAAEHPDYAHKVAPKEGAEIELQTL